MTGRGAETAGGVDKGDSLSLPEALEHDDGDLCDEARDEGHFGEYGAQDSECLGIRRGNERLILEESDDDVTALGDVPMSDRRMECESRASPNEAIHTWDREQV